ncbi:MAG TPA: hypothetical protein VKY74_06760 [Chloroflexia bacterium]|nr:hypothetical protein [Chloroflexia bacterium]
MSTAATWWVEWQYTEAEWAAFDAQEGARAQREAWHNVGGAVAWQLLPGLLISVALLSTAGWAAGGGALAIVLGLGLLWAVWNITAAQNRAAVRRQARRRGPRTIRIGARGLWEGDTYLPLGSARQPPHWIMISPREPQVLRFVLNQQTLEELRVPIPQGQEAAARVLVARFKKEGLHRPAGSVPRAPVPPPPPSAPVPSPRPTRRLPRLWVGGTPESRRYGPDPAPESWPAPDPGPEHDTQRLPPSGLL